MIQISNIQELKEENMQKLVDMIQPELEKRKQLYLRYKRKVKNSDLIFKDENKKKGVVPFEKYIINVSSGYLGGKAPKYIVENTSDVEKQGIIRKLLNKIVGKDTYQKEMEVLIDYITNYNDDGNEHYNLIKDVLLTGACYEYIYENEENEIVYSYLDPLQTVAIWDYSIPKNLIGLVRFYIEKDINDTEVEVVELIDKTGTRVFKNRVNVGIKKTKKDFKETTDKDDKGLNTKSHYWGDVPAIVVEQDEGTSLFECVVDLINDYEQLMQNGINTFQYNDQAKLKVTGYSPEEPLTKQVGNDIVKNEKREQEDRMFLEAKVFYTPDNTGDIAWIEKNVNDNAFQNTLKTLIDLILMNTGVPNVTDLGFTKADNASAIDRKFFNLEQMTIDIVNQLQMAYKRRWELIFNRINLKKHTTYDFRDVKIELQKNVPANESEVVDSWLKLRGLISDSTIIERLPYGLDALVEKDKMEEQEQSQLEKDIYKQDQFNEVNAKYDMKGEKNEKLQSKNDKQV